MGVIGLARMIHWKRSGMDGDRVDHRRGIHQQLHAKGHQEAQVAVLGGQRGDDDAEAQAKPGHHQDQERRERNPQPVGLDGCAAQNKIEDESDQEERTGSER